MDGELGFCGCVYTIGVALFCCFLVSRSRFEVYFDMSLRTGSVLALQRVSRRTMRALRIAHCTASCHFWDLAAVP